MAQSYSFKNNRSNLDKFDVNLKIWWGIISFHIKITNLCNIFMIIKKNNYGSIV